MANVSPDLMWVLVKNQNKFLVKRNGNSTASVQFSSEPNNLLNLNSFKHSGLVNEKTVAISPAGEDLHVNLTLTKKGKQNKPASVKHSCTLKRHFRKMAKAVINQVGTNKYRPDLTKAALARLSSVHKALRKLKAGGKKTKASKKALVRK